MEISDEARVEDWDTNGRNGERKTWLKWRIKGSIKSKEWKAGVFYRYQIGTELKR